MKQGLRLSLTTAVLCVTFFFSGQVLSMDDPYVGEIRLFAYDFCPKNWLEADGRLLAIANYTSLFSLYGDIYGGDGRNNFALPDLRGRVPIGHGTGPGRSPYQQGQRGGAERSQLSVEQLQIIRTRQGGVMEPARMIRVLPWVA